MVGLTLAKVGHDWISLGKINLGVSALQCYYLKMQVIYHDEYL